MLKSLFFLFFFTLSLQAVKFVAPNEVGLRPGVSGKVQVSINNQRGNTDKDEYDVSARVYYDNNRSYVTWFDFSYAYGQALGVENENKAYLHYRFLHTFFSEDWNWEAFAQNEGDDFRHIHRRLLGGAGVRWRFYHSKSFGRAYLGIGAYYEFLDYLNVTIDPKEHNSRLNAYFAYTKKFGKDSRISFTSYYQPKISALRDHYIYNAASLLVYIYGAIYIKMSLSYAYDTQPAIGIKKEDMQQLSSVGWKFGAKANR